MSTRNNDTAVESYGASAGGGWLCVSNGKWSSGRADSLQGNAEASHRQRVNPLVTTGLGERHDRQPALIHATMGRADWPDGADLGRSTARLRSKLPAVVNAELRARDGKRQHQE